MTFKDKIDSLFGSLVAQTLEEKKSIKDEDASNDKSDDGEGMDKVDPKAVKKKFKDRKDKDIDNDGDVDSSDEYLHKRRKAVSKAVANEDLEAACDIIAEEYDIDDLTEEQLDELIGKVAKGIGKAVGGTAKALYKGGQKIGQRLSTSGRADAAEKRAASAEKKQKDRERIKKAQDRLAKARAALNNSYEPDAEMVEFHAPGMAPKGRAKAKPSSSKSSLSDIRRKADNFKIKKKVKESVELDEESATISKVKEIVSKKQAMKIDGVMVDMFTASAISQIYDKVNDANKKKMDGLKITKLADVAMKLMKREEVEEELDENAKGALAARLAKVSNYSKKGKEKVTLKKAPWEKKGTKEEIEENLDEASCGCGPDCEHCKGNHDASEIGEKCSCCGNEIKESSDVQEKKNYEIKGGKIHISKKDFRKVHKDYKNTTKGKERMMALDPKTGGSASYEVVFTESSFKEKFKKSLSKRLSESAKTEEKSDEVANRYNELKQLAPVELMKLYQKHYGEDDIDKVKSMEKSELISKIVDKEFENQGEE